MKSKIFIRELATSAILFSIILLAPIKVFAHCDGLDGPVVKAAQKALESRNVNLVLIWVQNSDEAEIRKTFQKTLAVRELGPETKELADRYFFETLVRIHRAGEGAPYTGLKPAGRDLGPAIPAADGALESGRVEPLLEPLTDAVQAGIREQFKQVMAKRNFDKEDVEAGREYVETYVPFLHYVERIYDAAKSPIEGHFREAKEVGMRKEDK